MTDRRLFLGILIGFTVGVAIGSLLAADDAPKQVTLHCAPQPEPTAPDSSAAPATGADRQTHIAGYTR